MDGAVGFDTSLGLPRYLEVPLAHWGVCAAISDGECLVCTLPLGEKEAHNGLVVLACGHAFHGTCLSNGCCLLCR